MNNSNNNLPTFSLYRSIGIINKCAACLVCTLVSLDDGDTQQKNVVVYKSRQNHSQKRGKKNQNSTDRVTRSHWPLSAIMNSVLFVCSSRKRSLEKCVCSTFWRVHLARSRWKCRARSFFVWKNLYVRPLAELSMAWIRCFM